MTTSMAVGNSSASSAGVVRAVVLAALALAGACASVPLASPAADAAAKRFVAPPQAAHIYIYREGSTPNDRVTVSMDGQAIAETAPMTFILVSALPGNHILTSFSEDSAFLTIDAKAGSNHFVKQEVTGGFMPRSQLVVADEAAGRAAVARCRLLR